MQSVHVRQVDKRPDLTKNVIGVIIGFKEGAGRTGYQVEFFIRDKEVAYDCTKEMYEFKDTTEFFPYPCLGEILFMPQFDDNGILTHVINVNDITVPNNAIQTGVVMGTCVMFKVKIGPTTPPFGQILKVEGDTVTFTNYDQNRKDGLIAHSVYGGYINPADGATFKLAPDVVVYRWDWSSALVPFCRCSREEAVKNKFVTRFVLGSTADINNKNFWVGFYSTRGDESVCDLIKVFWNKEPGWTA